MAETPAEKAKRYLFSVEKVLTRIELSKGSSSFDERLIQSVFNTARSYVEDAKHYLEERPSSALAAVSYAEGLLDALRLLGIARFTWPQIRGDKH